MTFFEIMREITGPLTALGAIVAAVKSWLADRKAGDVREIVAEIKMALAQQQSQKQGQEININFNNTGGSGKETRPEVNFSSGKEQVVDPSEGQVD